jgi:hypothetical protein
LRQSEHTFSAPGDYDVQTTREGQTLPVASGSRPKPPQVQSANLQGDREVVVEFDEPISAAELRVSTPNGIEVAERRIDKQRLVLTLKADLKQDVTLELTGVHDLAAEYHAPTKIVVRPRNGPPTARVWFCLAQGRRRCQHHGPGNQQTRCHQSHGAAARLDHNYAMLLDGGSSIAADADARLLEACRASNALTIEATLTPANVTQEGPARIVTFSSDPLSRNFTLGQQRDKLIFRLRTPQTGPNGTPPDQELCSVQASRTCHVTATYSGGHVLCYVDGAKVLDSSTVQVISATGPRTTCCSATEWNGT